MGVRAPFLLLGIVLFLSGVTVTTCASYASCRRHCKNVGVQLKSSLSPTSLVQHSLFTAEVSRRMQTISTKTDEMKISYDGQISEILASIHQLKTEIKHTREALCPLPFNGRCYWAVFERDMNYTRAQEICARIPNGKPSNVYGHDHLFVVLRYLRSLARRNEITVYAWLGMTVDPESEKVSFTDGRTPKVVEWRPHQPDFTLSYTQLMIMARVDGNRKQEGLYNQNPAYTKPAVLCEA